MRPENADKLDRRDESVLLVIDDDEHVIGLIRRAFDSEFSEILNAKTLEAASEILAKHLVTHVICDRSAFEGTVAGERFMAYWRRERPSIQRVVLYTGADVDSVTQYPEIDEVVVKTVPLAFLVQALRLNK